MMPSPQPPPKEPIVYEILRLACGMPPEWVDAMDPDALDSALDAIVYHV